MYAPIEIPEQLNLPETRKFEGQEITFRMMTSADRQLLADFGSKLNREDLVFMRMDISRPEAVDEWCANVEQDRTKTIVALDASGSLVGYASLHQNKLLWTRHLGEIRLFVLREYRDMGIGRVLAGLVLSLARKNGAKIVEVNVPRIQPEVQRVLQKLGFQPEALLTDWLMDPEGNTHDMIIMSFRFDDRMERGD
ncbi:MAG TPA: GNAT family N-acetyltransferase [Candidatus Hydrogenedentes bacterium]|nr:GNAT family N-acetyltransferase [Candidatus Hydrogenedentota bacterium]HOJ68168.1 GNAT family N-acetyltransferase [Candidatus Hydrogenedentota bacterium]HOK90068.1 GNAT family N-acetyltransferase [Candidatus Hydrogenedentota bacterium]HOV59427.1 GNAT family N-acetyltransferase [Candidatus Hydrogenedentota bacterium]HPO30858.1 GNAT family N-acetyltransferase [Candidatus Hydrogenedentota bacterium]